MATAVWVVGTTRSGTSWAFDLVASHPDVSMGYESRLPVEGIAVYDRWAERLTDPLAMAGLLQDLRTSIDDPANAEKLEDVFLRPGIAEELLAAHRESPGWGTLCERIFCAIEGTSHWGNKILRVEHLPVITEHWPDSRFLVLTRDPRGVLASQGRKFDHSLEYSAMYWLTHATAVLGPVAEDPRCHVVDIVEMARDPRPHLRWLFEEAGLSTEPIDGLVERFPGDPDRLDAWRSSLDPQRQRRMEAYCFTQMAALGYEPELATAPKRLGAARRLWAQVSTYGADILRDPRSITQKQVVRRVLAGLRSG